MLSLRGPEMEERGDRLPPIRQDPVRPETYQCQIHLHWSSTEMPLMLQWYLFNVVGGRVGDGGGGGPVETAYKWTFWKCIFFKQPSLLITCMTSSWNVEIVPGGGRAVPAEWREERELSKDRLPIEHVHSWKVTFAFKTILISLRQSCNV